MFDFELSDEQLKELASLDEQERNRLYNRQLAYYRKNREREMQRMRDWYASNKEHKAEYYQANKERLDAANNERRKNDPDFQQVAQLKQNVRQIMKR